MRIGEIDLPEQLLDAQTEGTMVVFAGAGVSVAPPSNYPQLKELAERVARGSPVKRQEDEPLDRFLGRLAEEGVNVHDKLRELLTNPRSRPSSLHRDLLKLFPEAQRVRLVTTNFDSHFNTAARRLFPEPVETYYAPALPLGYDARGIIYLHGSIEKDPGRIVLTDGDFGRAYLTEGWARRFLQELFTTYTVVFAGYSHNDPVMNYLARGLPPEAQGRKPGSAVRRYVLTPSQDHSRWEFLGIEPVTYPLVEGKNPHLALSKSVAKWASVSRMGGVEHDRSIRKTLEKGPPEAGEAADYLARALMDGARLKVFMRHARGAEWMLWAEEQGLLDGLFGSGQADAVTAEVACWFASEQAVRHPEEALALVRRHGVVISPVLWGALAERFATREKPRLDSTNLARWIALLLHPAQQGKAPEKLMPLLRSCRLPEDEVSALLLFEYLTRPYLSPLEDGAPRRPGSSAGAAEIRLEGDVRELRKAWKELFLPRLDEMASKLAPIVTAHREMAHLLLATEGLPTPRWPSGTQGFLKMAERDVAERVRECGSGAA